MKLNEIKDNEGARKFRVRIGRGIGSGLGKMGGRGGKGQTARSGVRIGGFEGGQMPLHRRLPKRGFKKWRPAYYNEINVGALEQAVKDGKLVAGQDISNGTLVETGIMRRPQDGLRILGEGEISSALKLTANHVSAKARQAIEAAGGSITLIEKKVLAADEEKRAKTAKKKAAKTGGTKKAGAEE